MLDNKLKLFLSDYRDPVILQSIETWYPQIFGNSRNSVTTKIE